MRIVFKKYRAALNRWLVIWCLLTAAVGMLAAERDAKSEEPVIYITCNAEKNSIYEGEGVRLTFTLHSSQPRLAFANVAREASLANGEFKHVTRIETDRRGRVSESEQGLKMYSFPLETLFVSFAEKGDYQLSGGEYEVGLEYPMVYNDPFWGPTRSVMVEKKIIPVPPLKLKVKKLPSRKNEEGFSGAVGEFTVTTEVPPGEIIVGKPALAIIRIKGKGMIDDNILPDYSGMFGEDTTLKSISENKSYHLRNGALVTELVLECEFVPKEKGASIGVVKFNYFNPSTGKYEQAVSAPVEVKVSSGIKKLPTSDV